MCDMNGQGIRIEKARWVAALLSVGGVALSYIALEQHVLYVNDFETGPSFCHLNEHFNCEAVNASEWSSFLGIPIASYGLFFYLSLLFAALIARSNGFLPLRAWSAITFALSLIASVLSIVLFAISELAIGALCLMCIGLYVVNFLLLVTAWRSLKPESPVTGLIEGGRELLNYLGKAVGVVRGGGLPVRLAAIVVLFIAVGSVLLPQVLFQRMLKAYEQSDDPVARWKQAPTVTFTNDLSGGAFGDYYQGDLSAPLQIVEFADYECPACKNMYQVLHNLLQQYQGSYLFTFKNYPLDRSCNKEMRRELHQYACIAALFSRCAGEQGKFWEAMELLFSRDAEKGELTLQSLTEQGSRELSLDEEGIIECMESRRYAPKIQRDIADGVAAGLRGTPSVWVNGRIVEEPTARNLKRIFDSILKRGEG